MRVALFVLLVACGGGGTKSPEAPKSEGASCTAVADAMLAPLVAGKEETKAMLDKKTELAGQIRARCEEDAWSAEARGCITRATTLEAIDACSEQLTEDQRTKLNAMSEPAPGAPAEAPKAMKSRKAGDPCDGGE